MGRTIKSIAFRFGLPLAVFGLILLISAAFRQLFGFNVDLTILLIALLIATAWYMGRAPGIFIALLFETVIVIFSPPLPNGRTVFVTINRLALFISIVIFASSRRAAEQNLRRQREFLEITLKSIGDAVIATDADGRISFINPTAEQLTGWKSAEITGKPLEEILKIINEKTRAAVESPFQKVIDTGATVGLANHTLLISKDGVEIPIEDSGAPIRDGKGKIIGVIIVFHDVSERREAEREREKLLERERAARREAEIAGRLKDEFLATVSHELRTPLSAIQGWAVMLKKGHLKTEDAPNALDVIERNARLQGEIINDLLDVSQITTGKMRLENAPVEIISLLETSVESLRPQAEIKAVSLTFSTDESAAVVHGDAIRLRQIVWNLLSNSLKFTPAGGRIEVFAEKQGENIEIRVSDTGIGINTKFLPFIFDKFRQGDGSMTRSHGGLGLGLAIVRHLVNRHGGEILAASEGEGRGATFTMRLPLAENQRQTALEN